MRFENERRKVRTVIPISTRMELGSGLSNVELFKISKKSIKKSKIRIPTQTSQIFMYEYNHLQPLQFDFGEGRLGNVS